MTVSGDAHWDGLGYTRRFMEYIAGVYGPRGKFRADRLRS
jgi:hypothetical protein